MEYGRRPDGLRSVFYYLPKGIKFYDLKNEPMTRGIFLLMLAISFVGQVILLKLYPVELLTGSEVVETNLETLLHDALVMTSINMLINILIYLVSVVYLIAFLKELRHEEYTLSGCLRFAFRNSLKILLAFIAYALLIGLGALLFIIPGLIIYTMFLFHTCYIVDKECSIIQAFKGSMYLSKGSRLHIFGIIAFMNILLVMIQSIIGTASNIMIYSFVSSFAATIFNLAYQRMIALMYMDLEYGHLDISL